MPGNGGPGTVDHGLARAISRSQVVPLRCGSAGWRRSGRESQLGSRIHCRFAGRLPSVVTNSVAALRAAAIEMAVWE